MNYCRQISSPLQVYIKGVINGVDGREPISAFCYEDIKMFSRCVI